MPIYTYRCENCGVQFERQQKFSDQPLTRCPECNKKTLRKVYTPVGIVFKGSGFYATDHRSPSGASRMGAAEKSNEKPGEKSGDKPAEKKKESSSSSPNSTSQSQEG